MATAAIAQSVSTAQRARTPPGRVRAGRVAQRSMVIFAPFMVSFPDNRIDNVADILFVDAPLRAFAAVLH
jgi:hypothetical protein